ncbi:MAG: DUF2461 domain-containing protein [Ruminococcaceae bacterium]|nr:DUF2461 domain-containing protein [Oscillospiraceae bacterium]
MFQGFSPESVEFLWGIRFNNERSWFEEHKQQYIELIQQPLKELGVELQREIIRRHPKRQFNLHISRIYRDARRLHGRGPYKDHMWVVLHAPSQDTTGSCAPGFYFEIAPEYYSIGMGFYSATPAIMAKLRARIDRDPKPMERLARRLKKQDDYVLEGELYRRPKGEKGVLLNPWYNRRSIAIVWDRPCEGSLFERRLLEEIADGVDFLMPFYDYFSTLQAEPEQGKD